MAYNSQLVRNAIQPELPVRADALLQIQENLEQAFLGVDESAPKVNIQTIERPVGDSIFEKLIDKQFSSSDGFAEETFNFQCFRDGEYFVELKTISSGGSRVDHQGMAEFYLNDRLIMSVDTEFQRNGGTFEIEDTRRNLTIKKGDQIRFELTHRGERVGGGPGNTGRGSTTTSSLIVGKSNSISIYFAEEVES